MQEKAEPNSHEESRIASLENGRGLSYPEAFEQVMGYPLQPHKFGGVALKSTSQPHYSRRGGRSFPEPSDSERDPHWNGGGNEPLTPQQKAEAKRGIALNRAVGDFLKRADIKALSRDERDSRVDDFIKNFKI